ncbi:MAG: hypothetical protein AAF664_03175 [Planctomycetota bacterium]
MFENWSDIPSSDDPVGIVHYVEPITYILSRTAYIASTYSGEFRTESLPALESGNGSSSRKLVRREF